MNPIMYHVHAMLSSAVILQFLEWKIHPRTNGYIVNLNKPFTNRLIAYIVSQPGLNRKRLDCAPRKLLSGKQIARS